MGNQLAAETSAQIQPPQPLQIPIEQHSVKVPIHVNLPVQTPVSPQIIKDSKSKPEKKQKEVIVCAASPLEELENVGKQGEEFLQEIYNKNKHSNSQASLTSNNIKKARNSNCQKLIRGDRSSKKSESPLQLPSISQVQKQNVPRSLSKASNFSPSVAYECTIEDCESESALSAY